VSIVSAGAVAAAARLAGFSLGVSYLYVDDVLLTLAPPSTTPPTQVPAMGPTTSPAAKPTTGGCLRPKGKEGQREPLRDDDGDDEEAEGSLTR
jgi:hypothetical protein